MLRICHGSVGLISFYCASLEDQLGGKSASGIRTFSSIKTKADAIFRRSMNVRPERDRSQVDLEVMTEACLEDFA